MNIGSVEMTLDKIDANGIATYKSRGGLNRFKTVLLNVTKDGEIADPIEIKLWADHYRPIPSVKSLTKKETK